MYVVVEKHLPCFVGLLFDSRHDLSQNLHIYLTVSALKITFIYIILEEKDPL